MFRTSPRIRRYHCSKRILRARSEDRFAPVDFDGDATDLHPLKQFRTIEAGAADA
jgi:hypothetical protein